MAKISLNKPTSGFNLTAINDNFTRIEQEFQNKVLYRANPTGEPNTITNDIDLDSKNLLNVGTINGADASFIGNLVVYSNTAVASAAAAALSETGAAASALSASNSANSASTYSSMGLGGAAAFDLGSVADAVIVFPTNWGTVI